MASGTMSFRISDELKEQLKSHCSKEGINETDVITKLLTVYLSSPQQNFASYELRYLKVLLERAIFNDYMIIEHLRQQKDPKWDGKLYLKTAMKKAYDAEHVADEFASLAKTIDKLPTSNDEGTVNKSPDDKYGKEEHER